MRTSSHWLRIVGFRLAAILLGLLPLVMAETTMRAFGWGKPSESADPLVGFSDVHPLFVLNKEQKRYEIPPARQSHFRPESFAAEKGKTEFRIFCLGGSTVQGRPFASETSFTTWLELSLQAAQPKRTWKVVNCGGISYASYRLLPILEEVLAYEPGLIIVYTGQNEFLEDRSYHHLKHLPWGVSHALKWTSGLHSFVLARNACQQVINPRTADPNQGRPVLPAEVEALLDYRGGLEKYHRDEKWHRDVIEHFRQNLYRMVQMARQAGVPLMLANPVANLRDCPPFKAEHRADLSAVEEKRFHELWDNARKSYGFNKYDSIESLKQAIAIDDQHAGIFCDLGNCYDALEMWDEAGKAFLRSKDLDICPLRVLSSMNRAVLEVAQKTATPLVDVKALFEKNSREGIVGSDWLLDHVHPSIKGHQLIADKMLDQLTSLRIVQQQPGWKARREQLYKQHEATLDDLYYAKGMERLHGLRGWAQGRSTLGRAGLPKDSTQKNVIPQTSEKRGSQEE